MDKARTIEQRALLLPHDKVLVGAAIARVRQPSGKNMNPLHFPARQFSVFALVGLAAAFMHYGVLIVLVELFAWRAVPATLAGYVAGGIVSYVLNRTHTYRSDRPHEEAGWRFALVALAGFGLTWICMSVLHDGFAVQYLLAQLATTGIVLVWSFLAHKFWTFGGGPVA